MMQGETVATGAPLPYGGAKPEVLESPAGHYVGYLCEDGTPYSRESGYYKYYRDAYWALVNMKYGR